jgi:succinate dehydrogenase / fumarate reductase cytochrome b subunit
MSTLTRTLNSTIGRKVTMSITGLFLLSFLLVHLSGNFQLFLDDGGLQFNAYAKFMTTNPIIRITEIILLLGFLVHIFQAISITRKNQNAKGPTYEVKAANKATWFSRNMGLSGTIVLIFLVVHLKNFYYELKWGGIGLDSAGNKDLYSVVVTMFKNEWWYGALYVVAMVLLAFHLSHGLQSAFKTLGFNNNKYSPTIAFLGSAIAILIPAAFASFPIYFFFA